MSVWDFQIEGISYQGIPNTSDEVLNIPNPDLKCFGVVTIPAICNPPAKGKVIIDFILNNEGQCEVLSPFNIGLYRGDLNRTGDPYFETPELIGARFSGVKGDRYSNSLYGGSYYLDISGQLGTSRKLPFEITNEGLEVTGFQVTNFSSSLGCLTPRKIGVTWDGEYNYSFDANHFGTSSTGFLIQSIGPGEYALNMDNGVCSRQYSVKVPYPTLEIRTTTTGISCTGNGSDGFARAEATGGVSPYRYSWYNKDNLLIGTGQNISGLSMGSYKAIVQDAEHCELLPYQNNIGFAQIGRELGGLNGELVFTSITTNSVCCQEVSAKSVDLIVMARGGTPPYTFTWNDGATAQYRQGLGAGKHWVDIRDANGCIYRTAIQEITHVTDCIKVKWDFGNGDIQEYISLPGDIPDIVHTPYLERGKYLVKVSVVDGRGRKGIQCELIDVPYCQPASIISLATDSSCENDRSRFYAYVQNSDLQFLEGVVVKFYRRYINYNKAPYSTNIPKITSAPCIPENFNEVFEYPEQRTNASGRAFIDIDIRHCGQYFAVASIEDNPIDLVATTIESNAINSVFCTDANTHPTPGPEPFPQPEPTLPPITGPNPNSGGNSSSSSTPGSPSSTNSTPIPSSDDDGDDDNGNGDDGGGGGDDGSGGGDEDGDNKPDRTNCQKKGLDSTGLLACCVPKECGSVCEEGHTELSCCEAGGTALGIPGGLGTCSGYGFLSFPDNPSVKYCKVPHGACCSQAGCVLDNEYNCKNNAHGTYYPCQSCQTPEVIASCYKPCCQRDPYGSYGICTEDTTQKNCEENHGIWGRPCADCHP